MDERLVTRAECLVIGIFFGMAVGALLTMLAFTAVAA